MPAPVYKSYTIVYLKDGPKPGTLGYVDWARDLTAFGNWNAAANHRRELIECCDYTADQLGLRATCHRPAWMDE